MRHWLGFTIILLSAWGLVARADVQSTVHSECSLNSPGIDIHAAFDYEHGQWQTATGSEMIRVQSTLRFQGKEIPAMNDKCFITVRPRGIRCVHGSADDRWEMYPRFDAQSDRALKATVVYWHNNQDQAFELTSCQ